MYIHLKNQTKPYTFSYESSGVLVQNACVVISRVKNKYIPLISSLNYEF